MKRLIGGFCLALLFSIGAFNSAEAFCGQKWCSVGTHSRPPTRDHSTQPAEDPVVSAKRDAERLLRSGAWREAIELLETALGRRPDDAELRRLLSRARGLQANQRGWELLREHRYLEARGVFERALDHLPNDALIRRNWETADNEIRALKQLEQYASAADADRRSAARIQGQMEGLADSIRSGPIALESQSGASLPGVAAPPGDPGVVDLRSYDPDKPMIVDPRVVSGALTPQQAKAERDKDIRVKAETVLAALSAGRGNYAAAIKYLKSATALRPKDLNLKKALGYVYYLRDVHTGGIKKNPKVDAMLDALSAGQGDWNASLDIIESKYRAQPKNLAYRDAHQFLDGMSGAPADLQRLQRFRGLAPPPGKPDRKAQALAVDAVRRTGTGDFQGGLQLFRKAHAADPSDIGIRDAMNYTEGLAALDASRRLDRP